MNWTRARFLVRPIKNVLGFVRPGPPKWSARLATANEKAPVHSPAPDHALSLIPPPPPPRPPSPVILLPPQSVSAGSPWPLHRRPSSAFLFSDSYYGLSSRSRWRLRCVVSVFFFYCLVVSVSSSDLRLVFGVVLADILWLLSLLWRFLSFRQLLCRSWDWWQQWWRTSVLWWRYVGSGILVHVEWVMLCFFGSCFRDHELFKNFTKFLFT